MHSDEQISMKRQQRAQKKANQIIAQQKLLKLTDEKKFLDTYRRGSIDLVIFLGTPAPNDQILEERAKEALIRCQLNEIEQEITEGEANTLIQIHHEKELIAESPNRHSKLHQHPMFIDCEEEPLEEMQEKSDFFQEKHQEWEDYISDADDLYEAIDLTWEEKQRYLENNLHLDLPPIYKDEIKE